jgi:hypothetical protein
MSIVESLRPLVGRSLRKTLRASKRPLPFPERPCKNNQEHASSPVYATGHQFLEMVIFVFMTKAHISLTRKVKGFLDPLHSALNIIDRALRRDGRRRPPGDVNVGRQPMRRPGNTDVEAEKAA